MKKISYSELSQITGGGAGGALGWAITIGDAAVDAYHAYKKNIKKHGKVTNV